MRTRRDNERFLCLIEAVAFLHQHQREIRRVTIEGEIVECIEVQLSDIEAANRIMAIEDGCPFDTVCFHCQQAAEKYLKCLLTYLGIQAPRTHDLKALAALTPLERRLPVRVEDLAELNPYAVDVRRR